LIRVSEMRPDSLRKLLQFAALVEVGTGLLLMIQPALVAALLLGGKENGAELRLGRVAGIAMFTLGLACWPSRLPAEAGSPAFRAMLTYNVLVALYLAGLGTMLHLDGPLLWPGVALHAVVALLLVWTWRRPGPGQQL
jgi:hypothetical protein